MTVFLLALIKIVRLQITGCIFFSVNTHILTVYLKSHSTDENTQSKGVALLESTRTTQANEELKLN